MNFKKTDNSDLRKLTEENDEPIMDFILENHRGSWLKDI